MGSKVSPVVLALLGFAFGFMGGFGVAKSLYFNRRKH